MKSTLYEKLKEYSKSGFIPMHMPGHKRNDKFNLPFPLDVDITEIDGFDNLHNMNGVLKEISENIANVYKVQKSYMLVNGSSGGILSAIYSQTNFNDKIIVARNCHKSVYNIIEIKHLRPIFVMPNIIEKYGINGQILPSTLENAIKNNTDAKVVIITSPTYEGVASDIKALADICHKYNMLLIVDEAHGAHLGFDNRFIPSARNLGADIVINSLHKTMPALTQCALAHICTKRVNVKNFEKALSMFETSSPSYILLSSIDACVNIVQENGKELFDNYYNNLNIFYDLVKNLKKLIVVQDLPNFDIGKIIISTKNTEISGFSLANTLRKKYKIEVEMAGINYIIAMTSICDEINNLKTFATALNEIDLTLNNKNCTLPIVNFLLPQKHYEVFECNGKQGQFKDFKACENLVILEYVWVYPPGIPLLVPGEIITKDIINLLQKILDSGLEIKSDFGAMPKLYTLAQEL